MPQVCLVKELLLVGMQATRMLDGKHSGCVFCSDGSHNTRSRKCSKSCKELRMLVDVLMRTQESSARIEVIYSPAV